jgi:hypothetical protein
VSTSPLSLVAEPAAPAALYSHDLERGLVGSRIRYGTRADLPADAFHDDANRHLWLLMDEMEAEGAPVDPFTVPERAARHEQPDLFGGPAYVVALDPINPASVPYYAARVRDLYRSRLALSAAIDLADNIPLARNADELAVVLGEGLRALAAAAGRELALAAFRDAFPSAKGAK